MSIDIRLKHSSVPNKAPQPTDLSDGELALNTNTASPAAYIKDSAGNIVKLAGAGAIGSTPATETAAGIAELATQAEVTAGTDDERIVTPLKLQAKVNAEIAAALVPATETAAGIVELADAAETQAGTDGTRAVHPAGLKAVTDAERVTSDAQYVDVAGDTMTGDLTVPSLNGGPLAGFRNQLINGDFRINQRNGTRTPGVGVYGFDRWKGHAGGLEQIVEALPAGQWTLSWSGGGNGTFGGTTAASPITATVAGGDTSVVVPSTATNVQLEPGPVATPFEYRPIGAELTLCQRYVYAFTATAHGVQHSAASGLYYVPFPTEMRNIPSASLATVGDWTAFKTVANAGGLRGLCTAFAVQYQTTQGAIVRLGDSSGSSGANNGVGALVYQTGSAPIIFDSEL